MSSNPCNYIDYGLENVKWQIRAGYGCKAAGQSPWGVDFSLQSRLYTRRACET